MRVELHPEARHELRVAALWYEQRRSHLGDEFVAEVADTLDRIGQAPDSYPAWVGTQAASPPIRKAIVQRFPYVIAFERHAELAVVLAIAHAKRRPLYWLARAGE